MVVLTNDWDNTHAENLCIVAKGIDFCQILNMFNVDYEDVDNGDWKYRSRCLFHKEGNERTPSCYYSSDGAFHCFACNIHGDLLDFGAKHFGSPREVTAAKLAKLFGLVDDADELVSTPKYNAISNGAIMKESDGLVYDICVRLRNHLKKFKGTDRYDKEKDWVDEIFDGLDKIIYDISKTDLDKYKKVCYIICRKLESRK